MWQAIVGAIVALVPPIVGAIETLFGKKKAAGAEKLNAVIQLVLNGLAVGKIIVPQDIGEAETQLVQDIANAVVKYNNAKGFFTH